MIHTVCLSKARAGRLTMSPTPAVLIKQRKKTPDVGDTIHIKAGGYAGTTLVKGTIVAIRYVTRIEPNHWAYGTLANRMTLSPLDMKQLARECGYASADELEKEFSAHPAAKPLLKLVLR